MSAGAFPQLRADIQLDDRAIERDGVSYWQLYDPAQHRFFRVSEDTSRVLSIWKAATSFEDVVKRARRDFGIELTPESFQKLLHFLEMSGLLAHTHDGAWKDLDDKARKARPGLDKLFARLIVFKFPLARPESLLAMLAPFTSFIFTRHFTWLIGLVALSGLYLSGPDIAAFISNPFADFGVHDVVLIAIALAILKSMHELGHAVTAYRYGCRVPTIGVAFMVFMPLLYTDVTDAWRLQSKSKRLLISAAGMLTEIYLAAIATCLWAFLDDGPARDVAFYIATVGWISSVIFNLNPLAKFDGYYFISDALNIDNLQLRANETALWKLRETFVVPGLKPPRNYSRQKTLALIVYATFAWFYRLAIFTTIAAILYGFTAKLLGILLFALTVFQLLVMPIWKELRLWRGLAKDKPKKPIAKRTGLVLAIILIALFAPLFGRVYTPAILMDGELQRVFPPRDAKIETVHIAPLDMVHKGDPLVEFAVPELTAEHKANRIQLDAAKRELATALAGQEDRSSVALLRHEIQAYERRAEELAAQIRELNMASRYDGQVVQLSRELRPGGWVSQKMWVALIRSDNALVVRGYLREQDLDKVTEGTVGTFIPDDPSRSAVPVVISRISSDAAGQLEFPELSSKFGGQIPINTSNSATLEPLWPVFPVEFRLTGPMASANQIIRGNVVLNGKRESIASAVLRRVSRVLIKESIF